MHAIVVTDAERQRILEQGWTEADGVPAGAAAFVKQGGRYQLANRAGDGACVFLDEHNRCRIHAKFGESAKPLACRVYPFAFHPAGDAIALNLRFSCLSVQSDQGQSFSAQKNDLTTLRDLVVPKNVPDVPPPNVAGAQQLDWPDTMRIVRKLRDMLVEDDVHPLALRLVHALFAVDMLGKATFDKIRGGRIDELMDVLLTAAPDETFKHITDVAAPTWAGWAQFRLIVAQYARRDKNIDRGLRYRLRMLMGATRMARGRGLTPSMQPTLRPVPFEDLEKPVGGAVALVDEHLRRYIDVKMSAMAFCGIAGYGLSVMEGFQRLALMYPVIVYLAKWLAKGAGRETVTGDDIRAAMGIADHHFGYSPVMGGASFRQRVNWIIQHGELPKLVAWAGR